MMIALAAAGEANSEGLEPVVFLRSASLDFAAKEFL